MAAKTPRWVGNTCLTRTPESGSIVLAERSMLKDVYEGTYANCVSGALVRGTFGTGSRAGWVVASSQVEPFRGARAKLTIQWEPGGANATVALPCPDFTCEPIELYPKTERHAIFNQTSTGTGSMEDIALWTVSMVYSAIHAPTAEAKNSFAQQLANLPAGDQGTLGLKLLDKLRKGEETFYLSGLKYNWWSFSYIAPSLSLGGIIQWPDGPGSIPNSLPSGLSSLRLADSLQPVGVNGSMYKLTRTFMLGPKGHWDSDLYPTS